MIYTRIPIGEGENDSCSLILLDNQAVIQNIEQVGETNIATSIITAGKLIYMAENSTNKNKNLTPINQFIKNIRVYYCDI